MKMNDAAILEQLDQKWQNITAMLLWKLADSKVVTLTTEDMRKFSELYPDQGGPVIFTHGHAYSIEFSIVSGDAARLIAAHQRTQQGHA